MIPQTLSARRSAWRSAAAAAVLGAVLAGAWALPAEARVIHKERSLYSTIVVDQRGSVICLQFSTRRDQRNQTCMDKRRPREMVFAYTRMMMASLLLNPEPQRILVLGLGGGTLPLALDEILPDSYIDAVEIDPAVVRVAREFFAFAPSERVRVAAQDGRVFVKRALQQGERYDLIMLDAFTGEYIPEHMMTEEFLREVKQLLSEDGVLAANTFSVSDLYDHESVTYQAVFGTFFNMNPTSGGNRVVLARRGELPPRELLEERARILKPVLATYGIDIADKLDLLQTEPDWNTDARVLTDQFSPANLLR
ncbi:MAG: spermidine synthase [Pseudomonadales bacterium]